MASVQIPLPRVPDGKIIEFFRGLQSSLSFTAPNLQIAGTDQNFPLTSPEGKAIEDGNGYSLQWMNATRNNRCTIQYQRGVDLTHIATPDRLTITNDNNAVVPADMLRINEYVASALPRPASALVALGDSTENVLLSVIESHQRVVERLEDNLSAISNKFAQERLRIQTEQDSFIRQKQDEFNEREKQLREEVNRERQELAAQKKDLDDRTNMHARRGIQAKMAERLRQHAERFTLTSYTQRLRWPIHIVVGLVAALIVYGLLLYGNEADTLLNAYFKGVENASRGTLANPTFPTAMVYSLFVKLSLLSLVGLGLVTWYIRWLNRWFEQHAAAEFNLKQFELDINRASWVVETAMEWRTSEYGIIPKDLLESISRNLFSRREDAEDNNLHPSDYIMSALLGNASRARIKFGDAELEYARGALKKAASTVESGKQ